MSPLRTKLSDRLNREFYKYCLTENYPFVVDIERSHGSYLRSVEGQDIFDFAGYYGSKLIGHNHPGLYEKRYLKRLVVAANNKVPNPDFLTRECLDFYKLMYAWAPKSMRAGKELEVYAINSGAEAVENMLKYLISGHNSRAGKVGALHERRFVVFRKSFHGRTVFALSITTVQSLVITKDFHPLFRSIIDVDFPSGVFSGLDPRKMQAYNDEVSARSLKAIEKQLRRHVGEVTAIIIEPIQSAGGHNVAPAGFFEELSRLAAKYDVYLGFDEVQTGMGGSGKPFYVDYLKLARPPQAVAVAKKFGLGVLYMYDHLKDVGVLDSTWGGPLVDMVRARQELAIVKRERLIENTARNGRKLQKGIIALEEKYPDVIFNVRGAGFLQGFSVLPASDGSARELLLDIALNRYLLLMLGAGKNSIRLRPNLSTTSEDVDRFLELLEQTIIDFRKERPLIWEAEALRQRKGSIHRLMKELG
jgi:L-lysine 6-transaminase